MTDANLNYVYFLPISGLKCYFQVCHGIGLTIDSPLEESPYRFKAVARLIATHLALPFFFQLAALYNTAGGIVKGVLGICTHLSHPALTGHSAKAYFQDAFAHISLAVFETKLLSFSFVIPLCYALAPQELALLHKQCLDFHKALKWDFGYTTLNSLFPTGSTPSNT